MRFTFVQIIWTNYSRIPFNKNVSGILVRAACVHCQGTKCPLLTAFFLSFFLSPTLTFLQEGFIVGFRNFAWGFMSQKNTSWRKKKIGTPP